MSLDKTLLLACAVTEAAVLALLLFRHLWRMFPLFVSYSIWTLFSGLGFFVILRRYSAASHIYVSAYLADIIVDSALLFSVLVELALSALRPIRGALARRSLVIVIFLIMGVGAALWPLTTVPDAARMAREFVILLRLQQAVSMLSILAFLVLAAFSQLLSLSWRNRELQIATGLGIYALVSVAVTVLHTYPAMRPQYNHLDEFVVAAYLVSLLYWVASFARKAEERREFSPQMQSMLLAVAGAARATRVALADSNARNARKNDQ